METWKYWQIGRVYKRVSDGSLFKCKTAIYGCRVLENINNCHALYKHTEELNPADFLLCEGEERITKVRNKGTGRTAERDERGLIDVEYLTSLFLSFLHEGLYHAYVSPGYFRDLVQGKHADKFEFITEFVVTKEIPHESAVCKECHKPYGDIPKFITIFESK